jgi:hypothetical protein
MRSRFLDMDDDPYLTSDERRQDYEAKKSYLADMMAGNTKPLLPRHLPFSNPVDPSLYGQVDPSCKSLSDLVRDYEKSCRGQLLIAQIEADKVPGYSASQLAEMVLNLSRSVAQTHTALLQVQQYIGKALEASRQPLTPEEIVSEIINDHESKR